MSAEKFHIGYICTSLSWGGLEMNQVKNALKMKERGHQVFLIGVQGSPFLKAGEKEDIPIIHIAHHHKYFHFFAAGKLARLLKENEIQRIVLRDNRDIGLCATAKRWFDKQLRLFYFMEMQLTRDKKSFFHTRRFRQLEKWSCPLPYLKGQVSQHTSYPEENTVVIPSGIDLNQFDLSVYKTLKNDYKLGKDRFIFGLIGRLDAQKGQSLAIDAFAKIKDQIPNAELLFMGNPTAGEASEYANELKSKIKQYQLEDRIHLHPFSEDVLSFYNACDVIIMASYAETFGMVTLEAIATGTPVIGSDTAGTPDLLEQGNWGLLFESKNTDDLANKMLLAYQDRLQAPTHQDLKKYDFSQVQVKVENLLK